MRMEQEHKVTEDARRVAEQDAAAQRHAAEVLQVALTNTINDETVLPYLFSCVFGLLHL